MERPPADFGKFVPVYRKNAHKQNEQRIERAFALDRKKIHAVILADAFCHKIRNRRIFSEVFGKNQSMETTVLSPGETLEYEEFKRTRREAEIAVTLSKLTVDASRRETDKFVLKRICESAKKLRAYGVLVSPVHVNDARRFLAGTPTNVICIVGGTGESLPAIKKAEAKKAVKQGAREIRLVLCYSALRGGKIQYLKKEIKKIRKAVKKCAVTVSLEDHTFSEDDLMKGVRAACDAGAQGVCVRGEIPLVMRTVQTSAGKLRTEVSGVENAEQLRALFKVGALRATTHYPEELCVELHRAAEDSLSLYPSAALKELSKNASEPQSEAEQS